MLEQAVQAALVSLSPAEYQRVAEAYAEINWPERYRHLVPQGRNAQNATTAGWPDAWSPDDSGAIHAVEVSKANKWNEHLQADVAKAAAPPGGASVKTFVFVSAKRKTPKDAVLKPFRDDLKKAGIAAGDISLIFMDVLAKELTQGRFARLRADLLALPATLLPWVAQEKARGLYGDGSAGAFKPTWQEYLDGDVHEPDALDALEARLEEHGWALARGPSASGKTSLAVLVGMLHLTALRPVLYLDLAGSSEGAIVSADENMAVHGGKGVLFIVDNVHLDEESAGLLFDNWQQRQDGSQLLLVGRTVSPDMRTGTGSPIGDLNKDLVDTTATAVDFRGVYRRLALRAAQDPDLPPLRDCRRWLHEFGGDLLAFSSAVVQTGVAAIAGRWRVDTTAAVEYVRREYLNAVGATGRADLLRLAVLSYLEMVAPPTVVSPDAVRALIERGLAEDVDEPRGLRTAHPGLGGLILAAAGTPAPATAVIVDIAQADDSLAARAAEAMARHERDAVMPVWQTLINGRPATLLEVGLRPFAWTVRHLLHLELFEERELDELLCEEEGAWETALEDSDPGAVGTALGITSKRLPRCADVMRRLLEDNGRPADWLIDLVSASQLRRVAQLASQLDRLWPELSEALDEEVADALAAAALAHVADSGLSGRLHDFVASLGSTSWKTTLDATNVALADQDDDFWVAAVSRAPIRETRRCAQVIGRAPEVKARVDSATKDPSFVSHFVSEHLGGRADALGAHLSQLRRLSGDGYAAVLDELGAHGVARTWAQAALASSLGPLPDALSGSNEPFRQAVLGWLSELDDHGFSRLVTNTSPSWLARLLDRGGDLATRIKETLADDAAAETYATRVLASTPENALTLLADAAAAAVVQKIDEKAWPGSDLVQSLTRRPELLSGLTRALRFHGRKELALAGAVAIGEAVRDDRLSTARLTLATLSHMLRLTSDDAYAPWREEIVDRTMSPDWVEAQVDKSPPLDLAQALFSMHHYAPEAAHRIASEHLAARVAASIDAVTTVRDLDDALRLTGSAALIGSDTPGLDKLNVDTDVMTRIVMGLVTVSADRVDPAGAELWIGLRRFAEARGGQMLPLNDVGDVVTQMRTQDVTTDAHRRTLDEIADWLEAKAASTDSASQQPDDDHGG